MARKKEKPSYTLWQNSIFAMKYAWARDKKVIGVILLQILTTVGISTLGIFLPATVVGLITGDGELSMLIMTVVLFTIALVIFHGINNFLESSADPRRQKMGNRVGLEVLNKILTTDYALLEEENFTNARQKAWDQYWAIELFYGLFTNLGINVFGFIIYLVLLTAVNPLLMAVAVLSSILGTIATQRVNKWEHENDDEMFEPVKKLWYIGGMGENYALAKDIRLFGMANWIRDMLNANSKLVLNFRKKTLTKHFIADVINCFATFAREGIAYAYLIWSVMAGNITVEAFVLLFAAVGGFSTWVGGILVQYAELTRASLSYCRVREFLEYPSEFTGTESVPTSDTYELELKDVSFRYSGADVATLENINVLITPGEKLAIVGLNGAGKTTLIKLICGFYNPTEGQVLLNGQDIRNFDRQQYYALFTAVFQDFNILPLSIEENIASEFGETIDHERVAASLRLAGIAEKVHSLPNGSKSLLLKEVHTDAVELSGGQTQRLMLARALYKNAPILILDEPTAALDPIAESELYERYNELSENRTSIYISHRLASTRFCNRIILVDNKTIAEVGTHEQLMQLGGKYTELFEIQSKYYQDELEGGDGHE